MKINQFSGLDFTTQSFNNFISNKPKRMSNEKDQTTCCLIIVVLGLGKQLGASVCHDRLALWKENISLEICGRGAMGGRGGRGGKRLEVLFGVLDRALIIQVSSFLANP